jgi:hypothetical protein
MKFKKKTVFYLLIEKKKLKSIIPAESKFFDKSNL